MLEKLLDGLKEDKANWNKCQSMFQVKDIPAKTVLLSEGEVAQHLYLIKKGCLRMWFNKDGKDITTQFFFEDQAVASIDSFMTAQPSLYTLESIEPSTILSTSKENFELLQRLYPAFKEGFQEILLKRFRNYAQLFLSRIKDTPSERYADLIHNHPEIIKRVPQHYIASYLGITPISLSRIRNRK
jgi:CRP-like cAMP-binding protein